MKVRVLVQHTIPIFILTLGAGITPGRAEGSAVLSRWQGPRPPTAGGLNTGCRAQPCGAGVTPGRGDGSAVLRPAGPRLCPSRSREKMRCADFRVFSLWVQGPQPLPPTAQVILSSCRARQRRAALTLGAGVTPAALGWFWRRPPAFFPNALVSFSAPGRSVSQLHKRSGRLTLSSGQRSEVTRQC